MIAAIKPIVAMNAASPTCRSAKDIAFPSLGLMPEEHPNGLRTGSATSSR